MTSAGPGSSVLALNSGSSSLKFGLYRVESSIPKVLLSGEAESIGGHKGKFWAKDANGKLLVSEAASFASQQDAVARIATLLADRDETKPVAVGHRVVHGGPTLLRHCLIDDAVLRQLEAATRLCAAAQSSGVVGHSLRAGALPAAATSGLPRHGVSRRNAGCRAHPADPPGTASRTASNAMDFMAFLASRSCANSEPIGRIGSSLRISAMARVSPPSKTVTPSTPAWV